MSKAKNRYFIVSGCGKRDVGGIGHWTAGLVTKNGEFPSKQACLNVAEEADENEDFFEYVVLSISELSETDYKQFYGEE